MNSNPGSTEHVTQVKEKVQRKLMRYPGVIGVHTGTKVTNGVRTGEFCIVITVIEKKDLPEEEQIPSVINGVKTDVIEGQIEFSGQTGYPDLTRYDQVPGGCSISQSTTSGWGTMGVLVCHAIHGDPLILSNFHVMGDPNGTKPKIYQPGTSSKSSADEIAIFDSGQMTSLVDCAVAKVTDNREIMSSVNNLGPITKFHTSPSVNMYVWRQGAKSGPFFGKIVDTNATITVGGQTFTDQLAIEAIQVLYTLDSSGDSGSIVTTNGNQAVGLHFAQQTTAGLWYYFYANRIEYVRDSLQIAVIPNLSSTRYYVRWHGKYSINSALDEVTSVSMDDDGNVVVGYRDSANSNKPAYRTGVLAAGSTNIDWVNSGSIAPFTKSGEVTIALNENLVAVALEKNDDGNDLYSDVGTLNTSTGAISWNSDKDNYDNKASMPSSAIQGNYIVDLHEGSWGDDLYYRVGIVDPQDKTIDWGDSTPYDSSGTYVSGAINVNNVIIEVHDGYWSSDSLYYRVGVLDGQIKKINWPNESVPIGTGSMPAVAIDDSGRIIEVHNNDGHVSFRTGVCTPEDGSNLYWNPTTFSVRHLHSTTQNYNRPFVAMNNRGQIVVMTTKQDGGIEYVIGNWGYTPTES